MSGSLRPRFGFGQGWHAIGEQGAGFAMTPGAALGAGAVVRGPGDDAPLAGLEVVPAMEMACGDEVVGVAAMAPCADDGEAGGGGYLAGVPGVQALRAHGRPFPGTARLTVCLSWWHIVKSLFKLGR